MPKTKVLFVDDSPEKIQRSYGNYIRVRPFEGDPAPVPNVRTIEKRGWRTKIGAA